MPDDLQAFRIAVGDDAESNVVVNQRGGIDQHPVRLARQCRLGKAWADRGRDLRHRHRVVEALLAAIGKSNYGHATILSYEQITNRGQAPLAWAPTANGEATRPGATRPGHSRKEVVRASGIEPLTPTMSR